jgi:dTDP-4-amino-4,6-dideoxygalactose transaminase
VHAREYTRLLEGSGVITPVEMAYAKHVFHVYAIRSSSRERIRHALQAQQIQTGVHYPTPIHLLEAWADLGYKRGDFPVSEEVAREVLSLPMYPELASQELRLIASIVRENAGAR